MDTEIRLAIIRHFDQGVFDVAKMELATKVLQRLSSGKEREGLDILRVVRTIDQMQDLGELIPIPDYPGALRLGFKALESTRPIHKRVSYYLRKNWMAISALIVSLLALFRS